MWKIEHIFDGDYGCEERVQPVVVVTLKNEEGEKQQVTVSDEWLTERNLDTGSVWPEKYSIQSKGE